LSTIVSMRFKRGSGLIAKIHIKYLSQGLSEVPATIDPISNGKKIRKPSITSIFYVYDI